MSTMPDRALVWLFPPAGGTPLMCGELRRIGGGRKLAFRYDAAWLAQPDAFALAPDLPLKAGDIDKLDAAGDLIGQVPGDGLRAELVGKYTGMRAELMGASA